MQAQPCCLRRLHAMLEQAHENNGSGFALRAEVNRGGSPQQMVSVHVWSWFGLLSRSREPSGTGHAIGFTPITKSLALQVPLGSRDLPRTGRCRLRVPTGDVHRVPRGLYRPGNTRCLSPGRYNPRGTLRTTALRGRIAGQGQPRRFTAARWSRHPTGPQFPPDDEPTSRRRPGAFTEPAAGTRGR